MKIIVGLGNKEKKYANTRHNLGFSILDNLAKSLEKNIDKLTFNGLYCQTENCILLKPQTNMNNSGKCIAKFVDYFKVKKKEDLLVVYDDLSLQLGTFRYKTKGSAGGHNGIKDIINCLKSQEFKRLKIGIGSNEKVLWKDWVLQNFSPSEKEEIKKILPDIINGLVMWKNSNNSTTNFFNKNS